MKRPIYILLIAWLFLLTAGIFGLWYSLKATPNMTPVVETVIVEKVKTVAVEKEPEIIEVIKEVPVTPIPEPKQVIKFFDGGWESITILNAIAMYIIEQGYGYPVKQLSMSVDTMKVYLPLGDVEVNMELWRAGKSNWYDSGVSSSRLIDLGAIFERSTQGWYAPRYMIEGAPERGIEATTPGLKSAADLPEYWEAFQDPEDPEKGRFISCPVDWQCYKINKVKAKYYGLDKYFNLLIPESEAEMNEVLMEAYKNGEAFLSYYWEPTGLMGKLDMVLLEETAYSDECRDEIEAAIEEDPLGDINQACGCPNYDIHTGIYGGLLDRAPEVVIFLKNMFVGTERLNELGAYKMDNNLKAEEIARYYLKSYQNEWRAWVPADVAERVQASLE